MLPRSAEAHYRSQQALAEQTSQLASALWSQVDYGNLDGSYPADGLLVAVGTGQAAAAAQAESYLTDVLAETGQDGAQDAAVQPRAFVGASDGRSLDGLLYEPLIATKAAVGQGAPEQVAMRTGLSSLLRIVGTQVQDAGRTAVGAGIVARRHVGGYVRMLNPPSCARCTVLAGAWFKWNQGFQRHPLCDCRHIPAGEDLAGDFRTDPRKAVESGQVRGLSRADAHAIGDGADVGQVINAHRGMYEAAGRKVTTANASGAVRLRPEAIYAEASSREDAIRLLKRFGYLA